MGERVAAVDSHAQAGGHVTGMWAGGTGGDEEFVARLLAKDPIAGRELWDIYFDPVYAYLRVGLTDEHVTEDLTHDVFVSILTSLGDYDGRGSFRGWIFRIARNTLLSHHRKLRAEPVDPHALGDQASKRVGASEIRTRTPLDRLTDRQIFATLANLPLTYAHVLILRFLVGLTGAETGQVLDRSHAAIRQLQRRALDSLHAELGRTADEDSDTSRHGFDCRRLASQTVVATRRRLALNALN